MAYENVPISLTVIDKIREGADGFNRGTGKVKSYVLRSDQGGVARVTSAEMVNAIKEGRWSVCNARKVGNSYRVTLDKVDIEPIVTRALEKVLGKRKITYRLRWISNDDKFVVILDGLEGSNGLTSVPVIEVRYMHNRFGELPEIAYHGKRKQWIDKLSLVHYHETDYWVELFEAFFGEQLEDPFALARYHNRKDPKFTGFASINTEDLYAFLTKYCSRRALVGSSSRVVTGINLTRHSEKVTWRGYIDKEHKSFANGMPFNYVNMTYIPTKDCFLVEFEHRFGVVGVKENSKIVRTEKVYKTSELLEIADLFFDMDLEVLVNGSKKA